MFLSQSKTEPLKVQLIISSFFLYNQDLVLGSPVLASHAGNHGEAGTRPPACVLAPLSWEQ